MNHRALILFSFVLVCISAANVSGQTKSPASAPPNTSKASTPANPAPATKEKECVRIDAADPLGIAHCVESGLPNTTSFQQIHTSTSVRLMDSVTVAIHGLSMWSKTNDPTTLRLYLAGKKLSSVSPSLISSEQDYVNFTLRPTLGNAEERKKWIDIVDEARRHQNGEILVSAGPDSTMQPFPSSVGLSLTIYPWYTRLIEWFLVLLLVILILLGWRTNLLRDTTRGQPERPLRSPLSLGKVQMAWWFYMVIASYLYIWLITGEANTLSSSVLALIGISAATGLSAILVDQQKLANVDAQRAERKAVEARITALGRPATGSPEAGELQAKIARLSEIDVELGKLPAMPTIPISKGIMDILSDGQGVSFHRFQMVIWTIVLGIVFVRSVSRDLAMPDFDTTLLGLMGISSGTYIGFKFPEAQKH